MQHGEIKLRVMLAGEPHKLFTYWRGALPDGRPSSASVTILRPRRKFQVSSWWLPRDQGFYFEPMTRTEKKRAELSISDKALLMSAPEIATARRLDGRDI